jgi:16S rRNA C967 or C1407 C5-methylase (RsmB/RsmF family)
VKNVRNIALDAEALFFERIRRINPAIETGLRDKKAFSFRINRHRADLDALQALQKEGYEPTGVTWSPYVYTLPIQDRKRIVKSATYTQNKIYIQNLSSVIAALALGVDADDWVLDLAAAPGGKSLIFSETARKVSAVEPDKQRFFRMKRNFKEHGAKNIQTYNKDGRYVYKATGAIFDRVFLDAPCSSEAHIDLQEGITWWNLKRVRRFSKLQKQLIISAYEALKPGGEMVYATCTFSPEENEAVVDFLLKKYSSADIVPVALELENLQPGMTSWDEERFDERVRHTVRLLPSDAYSGFFFAKIKKNG